MKPAQLMAESVAVVCPACGEAQPAPDGSELWLASDFVKHSGGRPCVGCAVELLITHHTKVQFPAADHV